MPDWNRDGKQDWHDDYVINEVITDKNDKSTGSYHHSWSTGCTFAILIGAAILWEIANLLADFRY